MSDFEYLSADQLTAKRGDTAEGDRKPAGEHPLLDLQPKLGNQTIARLLQREMEPDEISAKHDPALQRMGGSEEDEIQGKHDPALQRLAPDAAPEDDEAAIQPKHDMSGSIQRLDPEKSPEAIGSSGGPEEEAMGKVQAKHDRSVQRSDEDLLAKGEVGLEGGPVSNAFANTLESQRGGGSPLDDGLRSNMENTLGAPLDDVRVHTGPTSDTLNRSITAQAFTTGSDVFVRSDKFSPGSEDTNKLLAHELTHVVQQRSMSPGGDGMTVGAADTSHEHEADEVANQVSRQVQRSPDDGEHEEG